MPPVISSELLFLGLVGGLSVLSIVEYRTKSWDHLWISAWTIYYRITREIRSRGTVISTVGTLGVVGVAYLIGSPEPIVIVTLFYATALFFTNFLQAERPFPIVSLENQYFDPEYGANGEQGFQYEFGLQNNGTTTLVDPAVKYRIFDDEFRQVEDDSLDGWIEHSDTDRADVTLEPGDVNRFEIEHSPIKHDGETDYYLSIKVTPRVQYSEVTLLFTRKIIAED